AAMPAMVHSPLRVARPAIREGWREGKPRTGADRFNEVSWDEALALVAAELKRVRATHGNTAILGGSYGWSSAGRVHHARSLLRRGFLPRGGRRGPGGELTFWAGPGAPPPGCGALPPAGGG